MSDSVGVTTAGWSRRRLGWAVGIGLALAVVVAVRAVVATPEPMWLVLALLTAPLVGVALATYVPRSGAGLRLELGCGPCAVVGVVLSALSIWLVAAAAVDGGNAAMAVVLAGFATVQRLSAPAACPA